MAQTDKLRKYKSLYSSTANSFGTGTGETITPASVSGLPTDTEITLTFDRVDSSGAATASKMERITGTISGGNLINYTRAVEGTEQAHTTPVVEMIWCADDWNDMIDGFLVDHNQDGTHGDLSACDVSASSITLTGNVSASNISACEYNVTLPTGNVQVAGVDPNRTITLIPGALAPTTTAGCASKTTVEAGTNDIDYDVLDFDASTDENAFVNFQMPDSWDAGVVQFRYVWTNAGGGSAETVTFELSGRAFADDDAIDQAVGTAVEVADTWTAQGDLNISAWSGDVTLAGTPAAGEWVHLEIMRDTSEDDLTGDARLIAVQVRYKQTQFGD